MSEFAVRTRGASEPLPNELLTGLDCMGPLDPEWTWLAEEKGAPVALLCVQRMGTVVMLMKLNGNGASLSALSCLLRNSLTEMKKRGITGYICFFNPERREEMMLLEVARKASPSIEMNAVVLAGKIPEGW